MKGNLEHPTFCSFEYYRIVYMDALFGCIGEVPATMGCTVYETCCLKVWEITSEETPLFIISFTQLDEHHNRLLYTARYNYQCCQHDTGRSISSQK
jgi:hypothetical protein